MIFDKNMNNFNPKMSQQGDLGDFCSGPDEIRFEPKIGICF